MAAAFDDVFRAFCGPGKSDIDGKAFAKLIKDSQLLDKKLSPTDVDLIFAKAVTKGQRRIDLQQCKDALGLVAQKKGLTASAVIEAAACAGGPVLKGTKTDAVRFHDDKSTYTGTHVNGGPESVPKGDGRVPPSQTLLRPEAPIAAPMSRAEPGPGAGAAAVQPKNPAAPAAEKRQGSRGPTQVLQTAGANLIQGPKPVQSSGPTGGGSLETVFESYCSGQPGMDGKSFAKACKDCHLLDKSFTPTDADLIFAKVVPKGSRRIDLAQFRAALEHVAAKKKVTAEVVTEIVAASGGPLLRGTQADAVRFHDDKSTYTGVHVHGGPEAVAVGAGTATQLAAGGMRMGH